MHGEVFSKVYRARSLAVLGCVRVNVLVGAAGVWEKLSVQRGVLLQLLRSGIYAVLSTVGSLEAVQRQKEMSA